MTATKDSQGMRLGVQGSHGTTPGRLAEIACLLEVTAKKPGNVHRFADLPGLRLSDFLLSAAAIAAPIDLALPLGVGAVVLAAIEATRRVVSTNTNLGIVLLLAPLAAVPDGVDLAGGVERILAGTTVADASLVYRAIRLAQPGGMGEVAEEDLDSEPTVTLRCDVAGRRARFDRTAVLKRISRGAPRGAAVVMRRRTRGSTSRNSDCLGFLAPAGGTSGLADQPQAWRGCFERSLAARGGGSCGGLAEMRGSQASWRRI